MSSRAPSCYVGGVAAVGMGLAALAFTTGIAIAPWSPGIHVALAGLAGGFTFPGLVYLSLSTSLASGEPRRGLEGLLACTAIIASLLAPLAALLEARLAPALTLTSTLSMLAYTSIQARRPRLAKRDFKRLVPVPALGGTAASIVALIEGGGVEVLASLLAGGFTLPIAIVFSPVTVGSVYRLEPRVRVLAQSASIPAALSPLAAPPLGVSAALELALACSVAYLAVMIAGALGRLFSLGAPGFVAATHISAGVGVVGGLAAITVSGRLDYVTLAHVALLGFAAPHAFMHVLVRGGEVPFTVRRRFWPYPTPAFLALASALRPLEPSYSWILVLSALLVEAAAIASLNPVPPAFKALKGSSFKGH
ncbi:MAG: hypothetical protein F7B17_05620 [Desulfurococcales archaeon]|nr:hypothetical protein [Desulfurococcales archaeon]